MKKVLFIIVLLLTPFWVFAVEEDYIIPLAYYIPGKSYLLPNQGQFGNTADDNLMYSTDYTYEDGVYTLTGTVRYDDYYSLSNTSPFSGHSIIYTCGSETEITCESLWHVFVKNRLSYTWTVYGISVPGGKTLEDVRYLTVGNDFVKEGDTYKLVDLVQYDKANFNHECDDIVGKYVCTNFETECEEIGLIEGADRNEIRVVMPSQGPVVGKKFEINSAGKYVLKDIVEDWWPNYRSLIGSFICYGEDPYECDMLAYIDSYSPEDYQNFGDQFEFITDRRLNVSILGSDSDEVEIKLGESLVLGTYFEDENVTITDESILEIKDGKIVPLKVGDTLVLGKNEGVLIALHVVVTQEMLDAYNAINPKTKTGIMIISSTVFSLLLVIAFTIRKKKYN